MSQKELLYYEDAIGHENNIIKICDETINSLHNEELISFMEKEKQSHTDLVNALINMLKEKANE